MKIIKATESLDSLQNAVFLAGPSPRQIDQSDWRNEAIKLFKELGFTGDILTPVNIKTKKDLFYEEQIDWEIEAMKKASLIMFWIPRTEEFPAYTTNIEWGEFHLQPNTITGFPDDSIRNRYIDKRLELQGKPRYKTLRDTIQAVINYFERPSKNWFTADTHFSAQRTLELSRRPFINTYEMDMTIINNWNKRITMNDDVYHLGDFGNFDYLKLLNFKNLYLIQGNYERDKNKDKYKIEKFGFDEDGYCRIDKYRRLQYLQNQSEQIYFKNICKEGEFIRLVHEPILVEKFEDDIRENEFCLFGHVHRTLFKKNGLGVSTDAWNFCPVSEEDIKFFKGGIQNYYDENVYTRTVRK